MASKSYTLYVVDTPRLPTEELSNVTKLVRKELFFRALWNRKTDVVNVFLAEQGEDGLVAIFDDTGVPSAGSFTFEEDFESCSLDLPIIDIIGKCVDQVSKVTKKLKYERRIIFFTDRERVLEAKDASFDIGELVASVQASLTFIVVPELDEEIDLAFNVVSFADIEDYKPKQVAPQAVRATCPTLSFGDPNGSRLELQVIAYPAVRKAEAPRASRYNKTEHGLQSMETTREHKAADKSVNDQSFQSGYLYGSEIVTVTPELQQLLKVGLAFEVSFEIMGFTKDEDFWMLNSDATNYILPKNEESKNLMTALSQGLFQSGRFAVARSVEPSGMTLNVVALRPYIDDNASILISTTVPFKQDYRPHNFRSLHDESEEIQELMDRAVESIDFQEFDTTDYLIPNPFSFRAHQHLASKLGLGSEFFSPQEPPEAHSIHGIDKLSRILDIKEVTKPVKEVKEENFLADEDEQLDVDSLLG